MYWKADKKTSAKIKELLEAETKMVKAACKLSKSLGGHKTKVMSTRSAGTLRVSGFIFDDESKADPKVLRKTKHGSFVPVKRASNRELFKTFQSFVSHAEAEIIKLIGLPFIIGLHLTSIGIKLRGDTAYIETSSRFTGKAKGCTRVSDLQYEKAS